jgi:hypothetical protein
METVVTKSKLGDLLTTLEQSEQLFFSTAKRTSTQQSYVNDTITGLLGLASISHLEYEARRDAYRAEFFSKLAAKTSKR